MFDFHAILINKIQLNLGLCITLLRPKRKIVRSYLVEVEADIRFSGQPVQPSRSHLFPFRSTDACEGALGIYGGHVET